MANDAGPWAQSLLIIMETQANLKKLFTTAQAPTTFLLKKWKTNRTFNDCKRRLRIAHAKRSLRRLSKQTGRCLTVLLKQFQFPFWGTWSMTGV